MSINKFQVKKDFDELLKSYENELKFAEDTNGIGNTIIRYMTGVIIALASMLYLGPTNSILAFLITLVFYIVYTKHSHSTLSQYITKYDQDNDYKREDVIKLWSTLYSTKKEYMLYTYGIIILFSILNFTFVAVFAYLIAYIIKHIQYNLSSSKYNTNPTLMFVLVETKRFLNDDNYEELINKEFDKHFKNKQ